MPVELSYNLKDTSTKVKENVYNILIFNTQHKHYIYSGNTGQIIEIRPHIKEILMGESIDENISKNLKSKYPCIFSPSPIKQINLGYNEYEIEIHVNKNLKQMSLGGTIYFSSDKVGGWIDSPKSY